MRNSQVFQEKIVLIDNLKVNYKIAGSGPAVLILHGWGGSSESWINVQKYLVDWGFKVIVPDLPGFGKSTTPLEPWGVDDYLKWVKRFADLNNLKRFFLVSHSFGGRIAIKFASVYSGSLSKLVLCDAAGIKAKMGIKTMIIFLIAMIGNAIFTPKYLRRYKDRAKDVFYTSIRHKDYVKAKGTMRETIKKVLAEDLTPDILKIDINTLIVWGEIDKIVPLKDAYMFKENIKNSKLVIMPRIGHSPHIELPRSLATFIANFFWSKK